MRHIKAGITAFKPFLEFPVAWRGFIALLLCDAMLGLFSTHLILPSFALILVPLAFLLYARFLFRTSNIKLTERAQVWLKKFSLLAESLFLFKSAAYALSFLIYFACLLNYPLVDTQLQQFDQLIGFDWLSLYNWFDHHGWLTRSNLLSLAYQTFIWQCVFLVGYFSFYLDKARLAETFWILFISLFTAALLSGLFPALGPVHIYKLETVFATFNADLVAGLQDVLHLRAGDTLNLAQAMHGTITFPSFHAATAVIYTHAFRQRGGLTYVIFLLNMLMLIATPIFGGHHMADILAGIFVALLVIVIVRRATASKSLN